jgi:dihydrofolate reductase
MLARADNYVIGNGGDIPWHIPGEQKHFKALTMGKPMVMGRRTFESLPGLLPGRRHIVLTRDAAWHADGAEVASSVEAAIALAGDVAEVAVIGGAEIYALFLPVADRIELTEVHLAPEGDTIVPAFGAEWHEVAREDFEGYSYVTLERA